MREIKIKIPAKRSWIGPLEITVRRELVKMSKGVSPKNSVLRQLEDYQVITLPTKWLRTLDEVGWLLEQLQKRRMYNKNLSLLIEQSDEERINNALFVHFCHINPGMAWVVIRSATGETQVLVNHNHKAWRSFNPNMAWPIRVPPQKKIS